MAGYGTETIDENREAINPLYRRMKHALKKEREKTARVKAKLFPLAEQSIEALLQEIPGLNTRQAELLEQIEKHQLTESNLEGQLSKIPARIKLKDMPDQIRYNKLKNESKMLMNILKMICYRAETSVANELATYLPSGKDEKRMLVKQIMENNADLLPDYENKTLTVVLHSLSAPRFNNAAVKLAELPTHTETIFPGTNLLMKFKISAYSNCEK